MANARKCDRCKVCFDPLDVIGYMARFQNPMFSTGGHILNNKIGHYLINDTADTYIDLCPKCAKAFEIFMKNDEEDSNEND